MNRGGVWDLSANRRLAGAVGGPRGKSGGVNWTELLGIIGFADLFARALAKS